MTSETLPLGGLTVLAFAAEGPIVASEQDAADLIGEAFSVGARMAALPLARLSPDFLVLSTRLAGHVLQKFINYDIRVAILGDVSQAAAESEPLRDFIYESNRGRWVWFVDDLAALEAKLEAAAQ
jgi:hypothetical protein